MLQELGVPVPRVILHNETKNKTSHEFLILSKSEGIDLDSIWNKLNKKEQEEIAVKMGEILGKIHTIKFDKYGFLTPNGIDDTYNFSLKKAGGKADINGATMNILSETFSDFGDYIEQFLEK